MDISSIVEGKKSQRMQTHPQKLDEEEEKLNRHLWIPPNSRFRKGMQIYATFKLYRILQIRWNSR